MRLIDADAFEKFIKEKYKDGESTDDIKDQMLFDLSYQPTAFDVEKVVKKLEERMEEVADYVDDDIFLGEHRAYKAAIDIVRGGRE